MRARLERFFSPAIRLKRLATPSGITGFHVDRMADWKLARQCDIPCFFPEGDYDKYLALAGRFGASFAVEGARKAVVGRRGRRCS